jgi:hypothetical protein
VVLETYRRGILTIIKHEKSTYILQGYKITEEAYRNWLCVPW